MNPSRRVLDPNRPKVIPGSELVRRFAAYHEQEGAWGSLHVVLDDGNVADVFVEGCVEWAREQRDAEGEALAMILLQMSQTQRRKLSRLC